MARRLKNLKREIFSSYMQERALDQMAMQVTNINELNSVARRKDEQYITERVYLFSNENLTKEFGVINLLNKNVLTVGSSGDQTLSSAFYGAREVTLLDKNIFTKYFLDLKIAIINNCNRYEFIEFFNYMNCGTDNDNFLSAQTYAKISSYLPQDSKFFWDNIYLEIGNEQILNSMFIIHNLKVFKNIPYLQSDDAYLSLRNNLKFCKIIYEVADIFDFPNFCKQTNYYSFISLSNIADYVDIVKYTNCLKQLFPYLTDDGYIQAYYEFENNCGIDYSGLGRKNYERICLDESENPVSTILLPKRNELKKDKRKDKCDFIYARKEFDRLEKMKQEKQSGNSAQIYDVEFT